MSRLLTAILTAATCLLPLYAQEAEARDEPEKLTSLREAWIQAKLKASRPIKENYLNALIKLKTILTKRGNLGAAVLVRDEIEVLTQGAESKEEGVDGGVPPQLTSLRLIYEREMARMNATNDGKYVAALRTMQVGFSKKGELESALAVSAEINKLGNLAWQVLFRSSNPRLWDTETDDDRGFARKLSSAPKDTKYLRLRNMDSSVVIPISYDQLPKQVDIGGGITWNGGAYFERRISRGNIYESTVLGVGSKKWYRRYKMKGGIVTVEKRDNNNRPEGLGGWGFGRGTVAISGQKYSWEGEVAKSKVFEISVSSEPLTTTEARLNLVK